VSVKTLLHLGAEQISILPIDDLYSNESRFLLLGRPSLPALYPYLVK
jgi:hypothetical protein